MSNEWRKGWFGPQRGAFTIKGLKVSPSGWKGWALYVGFFPTFLALLTVAVISRTPWLVYGSVMLVAGFIAATRLLYDATPSAPSAPRSPRHPSPPVPPG